MKSHPELTANIDPSLEDWQPLANGRGYHNLWHRPLDLQRLLIPAQLIHPSPQK